MIAQAPDDEFVHDLHDGPGQLFVAINLLSSRYLELLPPDSPWRPRIERLAALADQGRWETEQIIRGALSAPRLAEGLEEALRRLAGAFEADSGMWTRVETSEKPLHLGPAQEGALYRVAHLALINAWRHARGQAVRVELSCREEGVRLIVTDDGAGLGPRWERRGTRVGVSSMRRIMASVGGTCHLRNARPNGLRVEAYIPLVER